MTSPLLIKKTAIAAAAALSLALAACGGGSDDGVDPTTPTANVHAWMTGDLISAQSAADSDAAKEEVAGRRARLLIAAMSTDQKMQQLDRRHARDAARTARVLWRAPCERHRRAEHSHLPHHQRAGGPGAERLRVASAVRQGPGRTPASPFAAYTDPSSAKATALPSAIGAAASFDPAVAAAYGDVIGTEMNNLALHVFEAPGVNLARLPILGRNFEYFGEDPLLTGTMAVAEVKAVQAKGLIGMPKHFVGNEQETNRQKIQETIDPPGAARALPAAVRDGGEGRQGGLRHVRLQLRQRRAVLREQATADRACCATTGASPVMCSPTSSR